MEALLGFLIIGFVIFVWYNIPVGKDSDTVGGRWGTKIGKVASGRFGGPNWGE